MILISKSGLQSHVMIVRFMRALVGMTMICVDEDGVDLGNAKNVESPGHVAYALCCHVACCLCCMLECCLCCMLPCCLCCHRSVALVE